MAQNHIKLSNRIRTLLLSNSNVSMSLISPQRNISQIIYQISLFIEIEQYKYKLIYEHDFELIESKTQVDFCAMSIINSVPLILIVNFKSTINLTKFNENRFFDTLSVNLQFINCSFESTLIQ